MKFLYGIHIYLSVKITLKKCIANNLTVEHLLKILTIWYIIIIQLLTGLVIVLLLIED